MRAGRTGRYAAVSVAVSLLALGQAWGALPTKGPSNVPAAVPSNVPAAISTNNNPDAAINSGNFTGYSAALSTWLNQKMPPRSTSVPEATLKTLLANPVFANTLGQRQLIAKIGANNIGTFAKADQNNRAFLAWLLRNTQAMELYLEGGTPTGIQAREANTYTLPIASLDIWKQIFYADPDAREGLYLRLAIATGLNPPPAISAYSKIANDPVTRYKYFKTAHKNRDLFPSFDTLTVWEYSKVVNALPSDSELTWAREMINTWRPDLRIKEKVVDIVSQVWRRASPIPYTNMQTMLEGGGKCGPRSTFGVMINQAFGIPAIGVGQPSHACVAWKSVDGTWKVGYGGGWDVSRLDGLSGPDFVAGVEARSRVAEFSQVEHLRWLAAALASKEQAAAVMRIAQKLQQSAPAKKTDLTASEKADEANADPGGASTPTSLPPKAAPARALASTPGVPLKTEPVALHVEAASFAKMGGEVSYQGLQTPGVCVHDSFTGGKQVYFQANMKSAWADYTIDVPATGAYGLVLRTAAANSEQKLEISLDGKSLATVDVPMSTGLWATTPEAELKLEKGTRTLRISAGFQRGVAVKWFELRPQGMKDSIQGLRTVPASPPLTLPGR